MLVASRTNIVSPAESAFPEVHPNDVVAFIKRCSKFVWTTKSKTAALEPPPTNVMIFVLRRYSPNDVSFEYAKLGAAAVPSASRSGPVRVRLPPVIVPDQLTRYTTPVVKFKIAAN